MPKEGRKSPVTSNNRTRVSPYPLRSTRSDKVAVSLETEGPKQWEDVQCVICMEPPHNAVLLHCSSYHNGCRPYICDSGARHSNCLKQFRSIHKTPCLNNKSPNCPLCRGDIYETVKVKEARRFMNAKPRTCSIEDCEFSGTYSQLNTHLKAGHRGFIPPKVDPSKQQMWEEMERAAEFNELMSIEGLATRLQVLPDRPPLSQHRGTFRLRIDAIAQSRFALSRIGNGFGAANYAAALRPGTEFRATMFQRLPSE